LTKKRTDVLFADGLDNNRLPEFY